MTAATDSQELGRRACREGILAAFNRSGEGRAGQGEEWRGLRRGGEERAVRQERGRRTLVPRSDPPGCSSGCQFVRRIQNVFESEARQESPALLLGIRSHASIPFQVEGHAGAKQMPINHTGGRTRVRIYFVLM